MFQVLYVLFFGFWRDCFGKDGYEIPILKYRFIQHILGFIATASLCYWCKDFKWYSSLWVALWIQIEWALAHGPCYDVGEGGQPDEKMIKRYEKMVGYKTLCKMFPKDKWYGVCFDYMLLAIRYTYPIIPMMFNPVFITLGLVVSGFYAIYRYCPFMKKYRLLDVEIWVGFAVALFVAFL